MELKNFIIPKKKSSIYPTLFYLVHNMILAKTQYEGLDNTYIGVDDIERALMYSGMCAIFKNKGKIVALPCVTETLNLQGRPATVGAYSYAFQSGKQKDVLEFEPFVGNLVVGKDCALILNNAQGTPTLPFVVPYIKRLDRIWEELGSNLKISRAFAIFAGSSELSDSFDEYYSTILDKGMACVSTADVEAFMKSVQKFDLNIEYRQEEYHKDFDSTWIKLITILGFNNVGMEKRERLLVDEIGANNEVLDCIKNTTLMYREKGIKEANKLFGLNIKIVEEKEIERKEEVQTPRSDEEVGGTDK